jgi:precorrin-6B methylase 2
MAKSYNRSKRGKINIVNVVKQLVLLLSTFLSTIKSSGLKVALRHTYGFVLLRVKIMISLNNRVGILGAEIRKMQLSNQIGMLLGSTVKYGPFTGLCLENQHSWLSFNRGNMLLGLYEKEVVSNIVTSSQQKDYFIDIGAADGYFALGVLVGKLFEHSYCFESTSKGQQLITKNAVKNNLINQISVFGKAEIDFLSNIPQSHIKNSVVLIDIEGGDFNLLTEDTLEKLSGAHVIIELHHMFLQNGLEILSNLRERVEKWFKIEILETASRDLSKISEISKWSDTDRWIMCSEGRPMAPIWWKLTPK